MGTGAAGSRSLRNVAIILAVTVASAWGTARRARACSPLQPTKAITTLPRAGATEIPTASSFVVAAAALPADLTLEANGAAVPLKAPAAFGVGRNEVGAFVTFWRVEATDLLPASSDLVLSAAGPQAGPRVVLTSVKTAAGYDKQAGTPAVLKSLKLKRVRYPREEIASGNCVFDEYTGYIAFESDVATFPGTPADSIVNTLTLRPKTGGAGDQAFTWDGSSAYQGDPPTETLHPAGGWTPYLDPTLEYCATITSFGVGDLARMPVTSNTLCATVEQLSSTGPAAPAASSGGCATTGNAPAARTFGVLAAVALLLAARRRVSGGTSARRS
jgi:hypothetical protein